MQYLGHSIAIGLLILAFVFFIVSIYVSYKGINIIETLPNRKAQISQTIYMFLSGLSLSLFLFVVLTTENGFSWDAVGMSVGLLVLVSAFLAANFVITSKTTDYLNKRGISLEDLKQIKEIMRKTNKDSAGPERSSDNK